MVSNQRRSSGERTFLTAMPCAAAWHGHCVEYEWRRMQNWDQTMRARHGMQVPCGAGERRMRLEGIRALDAQSIGMNFPAKGSIRLGRQ